MRYVFGKDIWTFLVDPKEPRTTQNYPEKKQKFQKLSGSFRELKF